MKAAVFHGVNQPLTIEDIDVDEPREHEVLVRTAAAGVCHSELHMVEGHSPVPPPAVLGHESAGVVERVGSRVSYVQPGDHVIARGTFCGHCEMCLTGHLNVCTSRPGRDNAVLSHCDPLVRVLLNEAGVFPGHAGVELSELLQIVDQGAGTAHLVDHRTGVVEELLSRAVGLRHIVSLDRLSGRAIRPV